MKKGALNLGMSRNNQLSFSRTITFNLSFNWLIMDKSVENGDHKFQEPKLPYSNALVCPIKDVWYWCLKTDCSVSECLKINFLCVIW